MSNRNRTNTDGQEPGGCASALFWFTLACLVIACASWIAKMMQN